jgi:hypothetical protein
MIIPLVANLALGQAPPHTLALWVDYRVQVKFDAFEKYATRNNIPMYGVSLGGVTDYICTKTRTEAYQKLLAYKKKSGVDLTPYVIPDPVISYTVKYKNTKAFMASAIHGDRKPIIRCLARYLHPEDPFQIIYFPQRPLRHCDVSFRYHGISWGQWLPY